MAYIHVHILSTQNLTYLAVNSAFFQIGVLKKNIAKYESDYEQENGYPIAPCDRITDVQLTRMYETLRLLQEEKRCIKADPVEYALKVQAAKLQKERDDKLDESLKSDKSMADIVKDIEDVIQRFFSVVVILVELEVFFVYSN